MTHTTYILFSPLHRKIYVGESSHLIQRFYSHNFFGHDWTKRYRPWEVIYCEYYELRKVAKKREKQLKGGKGRAWIWSKIDTEYPNTGFISAWGGRQFKSAPRYKQGLHQWRLFFSVDTFPGSYSIDRKQVSIFYTPHVFYFQKLS